MHHSGSHGNMKKSVSVPVERWQASFQGPTPTRTTEEPQGHREGKDVFDVGNTFVDKNCLENYLGDDQ